jgi:uncharacterized protein
MELTLLALPLIAIAGTAAGFINVVAGGGSLITLPVLIFLGMPPAMANGTNRVAQLGQNSMAMYRFGRKGYFPWRAGLILGVAASFGALVGSRLAVDIPPALFNRILSGIMVVVLILTLTNRKPNTGSEQEVRRWGLLIPAFFFVGMYGGFIQAGVGFLIMAAFSRLSSTSLVLTNAVKVMVVFIYTFPALAVFLYYGQVDWAAGLVLGAGTTTGAWLGAHFSVSKGDRWIKVVLTAAVLVMAVRLFFFS